MGGEQRSLRSENLLAARPHFSLLPPAPTSQRPALPPVPRSVPRAALADGVLCMPLALVSLCLSSCQPPPCQASLPGPHPKSCPLSALSLPWNLGLQYVFGGLTCGHACVYVNVWSYNSACATNSRLTLFSVLHLH